MSTLDTRQKKVVRIFSSQRVPIFSGLLFFAEWARYASPSRKKFSGTLPPPLSRILPIKICMHTEYVNDDRTFLREEEEDRELQNGCCVLERRFSKKGKGSKRPRRSKVWSPHNGRGRKEANFVLLSGLARTAIALPTTSSSLALETLSKGSFQKKSWLGSSLRSQIMIPQGLSSSTYWGASSGFGSDRIDAVCYLCHRSLALSAHTFI